MKKGKTTIPEQKKSGDRIGYTYFVYRIHVIGTSNLSIKFDRYDEKSFLKYPSKRRIMKAVKKMSKYRIKKDRIYGFKYPVEHLDVTKDYDVIIEKKMMVKEL
jgi:hypothetical protein